MDIYTATELAYKNGYKAGIRHAKENFNKCNLKCENCIKDNNINNQEENGNSIPEIKEFYQKGFLAGVKNFLEGAKND